MREINVLEITESVEKLCIDANMNLNSDIKKAFLNASESETKTIAKDIINILIDNADISSTEQMPMCQDTGFTVVFLEIGQDVHITGGNLTDAINKGVASAYEKGFLRKSVVNDPIERINTKTNTPAVIHIDIVDGDSLKITVAPKGFGSENMSALCMLKPSAGIEGVKKFIIETVKNAGPNACPPLVLGIGVGGTMEKCALMSKKALLRELGTKNKNSYWAGIEEELFNTINGLDIGPGGFGGKTTALSVNIETYATHIAGLPVAVNVSCHATRHAEIVL